MARLNTFVHVVEQDDQGNTTRSGVFGPADVLPEWAVRAISNPDVWAEGPRPMSTSVSSAEIERLQLEAARLAGDRPKGNASRDAWLAYATSRDIQVADAMSRDDIIAAVDLLSAEG